MHRAALKYNMGVQRGLVTCMTLSTDEKYHKNILYNP